MKLKVASNHKNMACLFSIIIPVLHETNRIQRTISDLLVKIQGEKAEIIVVDGDPNGSTINAITHFGIKTAISVKGRANQMNAGASLSSGDILLFLHADTLLPPNALKLAHSVLQNSKLAAGAFRLGIDSKKSRYRLIEFAVNIRTRITRIPYGDQAFFIKKGYFEKLGGFKSIPIMEDVALMRLIKKRKAPIAILPLKVMSSDRRWEQEGIFFCTFRNWALMFFYLMGVDPHRLERLYYR